MNKKPLIYLTAFFCGMSIMAVELSASRLLAPYFGTSSIIWTVIIGLIMISLSLGNVLGGRLADKHNNLDRLYMLIWFAAIWIAVIPLVGKYIIALSVIILMWILPESLLVAGSVLSCLIIFSVPMVILGMASPWLVKLGVDDMDTSGRTTGQIYATSTIGSIIGTFIPTFLTIPVIGTGKSFLVFALVLNVICVAYFITQKTRILRTAVSSLLILVLLILPLYDSYAFWKNDIVYEGESLYNYVQVAEDSNAVYLSTNVAFGVQSIYPKDSTLTGYYYDYAMMAPLFLKNADFNRSLDMLVLGLGTGTYAKLVKRFYPGTHTDGVEIDPTIARLSRKYFELNNDEADIYVNDGRTFLMSPDAGKYDIIMIDAYHDITIPFHMSTKEFFAQVKKHLLPGGVLVMNINMRSEKNTEITDYLTGTVRNNWQQVYRSDMENGTNTLVFASDEQECLNWFRDNTAGLPEDHILRNTAHNVLESLTAVKKSSRILTDDLAPVELMGQKVLDELVSDTIRDYRDIIKNNKKGIKGLFDLL